MARNGSGTYSLPAGNPVTTGTTISSTWANNTLSDISTALTQSIAYDGQTTPIANLPMGGNKHTGVANASVRTNYASAGDVQDGTLTYLTSVSGTDTITAVGAVGMTAYAAGQTFRFLAAGANTTTTVTLNINAIGAKNIVKVNGSPLVVGDIPSGGLITVAYDGTSFQLQSSVGVTSFSAGSTGFTPSTATSGAITLAGVLGKLNGGTGALTATISQVSRTSNVSTITTSSAHGFVTNDYVTVAAVTNTGFNGSFTITGTPTSTSFTYAQVAGNVSATADTGTVTDLSYCNLAQNVTGTLYPNYGGTGLTTVPTGNLLVGNATSSMTSVTPSNNGQALVVTAGSSVTAGSFVIGATYTITSVGTTSFTSIGASANTVGVSFTATGVGSGTGTATLNTWAAGSSVISSISQSMIGTNAVTFTNIPSWAKRITVITYDSNAAPAIRLGTSSGIVATGYTSAAYSALTGNQTSGATSTTQFITQANDGAFTIYNITGNTWVSAGTHADGGNRGTTSSGFIALSGALTQIQLIGTFTSGTINILYE